LVLATGAGHDYFGHNEWADLAPGLKSVEDALEIRRRVFLAFEAAERETDSERRKDWLTFVVVGGGPTGVELAGALGEIAHNTLKDDFRTFNPEDARIILAEGNERVLATYPESLSEAAAKSLAKLGVEVRTSTLVTSVDESGATIEHADTQDHIRCRTILWSAGVKANPLGRKLVGANEEMLDSAGRVKVDDYLRVPGCPDVYVIGDLAAAGGPDGEPLQGTASVAMSQGKYLGKALSRRARGRSLKPYRYVHKGSLATIGRAAAVADFGKLRFSGVLAWFLWLSVHLMYLVGFQNRLVVFVQWAWSYLTYNRGARLITGPKELRLADSSGPHSDSCDE
jgi:NADH dehydrogenase